MTDTKLEPELPQEVPYDVAAAFFRERDKLNIIEDGTVAHLIAVGAVKDALSAIEADRNKRASVGSLTDEQIRKVLVKYSKLVEPGLYSSTEFDCADDLLAFARALLSSVAPRVPDGWRKFGAKVLADARENLGADVDGGDIQDWAEEAGLLVKHYVSESCGEHCICAEVGFPSDCYRYSDEAMEAVNAIAAAPQPTQEG